jgi:lipopolysaccharide export system protein LptC
MSVRANPAASLFPLLLVGLLAGMSYWLELASRAPTARDDGKSRHDPDYIVENFEVSRFDQQGNLQHTVVADLMRHYPDDDSTVVLAPRLTYHRDPPTYVVAREAQISSKGEHVELIDDVRVTRAGQAGKPDTVLTTSRLDAWPDDEIARTNQPVKITQGQTQVDGSGLSVDNKTSIYILEGPVRGVFFRDGGSPAQVQRVVTPPPAANTVTKPTPKSKSKVNPAAKRPAKAKPTRKSTR